MFNQNIRSDFQLLDSLDLMVDFTVDLPSGHMTAELQISYRFVENQS